MSGKAVPSCAFIHSYVSYLMTKAKVERERGAFMHFYASLYLFHLSAEAKVGKMTEAKVEWESGAPIGQLAG